MPLSLYTEFSDAFVAILKGPVSCLLFGVQSLSKKLCVKEPFFWGQQDEVAVSSCVRLAEYMFQVLGLLLIR